VTRASVAIGLVGASLLAGAAARADDTIWDRAVAEDEALAARARYEQELEIGNEDVQLAASEVSWRDKKRHVVHAVSAYRNATIALPDEPEAHYRLATTQYTYYLVCQTPTPLCDPDAVDVDVMRDVVTHMHEFTRLAPLDIRGTDLLFQRAILHTKLTTKEDLEAAVADYEAYLDRIEDNELGNDTSGILGNLAETYMMVGRLDDAIAAYERAAAMGGDVSTVYGLAVALDRDGQGTRARQIITSLKLSAFELFQQKVAKGETFFVPEGEVNYYLALVEEALGMPQQAIVHWDLFIRSKAHPEFADRAKHNRDALKARVAKSRTK
jgi:tetratricopeptide (TPR) repeat protein